MPASTLTPAVALSSVSMKIIRGSMYAKAIETEYKGYRFRSRLEARWAVFFEEHGDKWQYEVEGYELPSGRYLPDFYLPTWEMFVEVKPPPAPMIDRPRVYMAGRMKKPNWRPFHVGTGNHDLGEGALSMLVEFGGVDIDYAGPFQTDFDDHGTVHGISDCFTEEGPIFRRSISGVRSCDIFFALFEDLEAFGTLVELGAAVASSKTIVIGFNNEFFKPHDEAYDQLNERWNPLWFAARSATKVWHGSREDILRWFGEWLLEEYQPPRELRLARELHKQTGKRVSVVYGDPVEAFSDESAGVIDFSSRPGRPMFEDWSYQERDAAASAARQARFEYGQSGAR